MIDSLTRTTTLRFHNKDDKFQFTFQNLEQPLKDARFYNVEGFRLMNPQFPECVGSGFKIIYENVEYIVS